MMSRRWDDFKQRRLDAYKHYIAVVKKIKNMKTYILHIQISKIMYRFADIMKKKIKMKKNALARGFISIKILISMSRKARRYADDRNITSH